jgi:hypothetical protein
MFFPIPQSLVLGEPALRQQGCVRYSGHQMTIYRLAAVFNNAQSAQLGVDHNSEGRDRLMTLLFTSFSVLQRVIELNGLGNYFFVH